MTKKYIVVFAISFFIMIFNSWQISIFSLDEAKNATCAREMLERGDFIVPTFNYELRTDKPPVHYWFMMLAYKLFGVSEFSARFFSAIFGALTVLVTYIFAERFFSIKVALISLLVLLSSFHFILQFHMAVPDPYLIFFLTTGFYSFYTFYTLQRQIYLYLFYTSIGLAVLTKGVVGVVLPGIIIVMYLLINRNLKFITKMKPFHGLFIIGLISLPWYITVGIETDWLWIKEFFFKHNISRFSEPMEGHGGIFLITFLFVFTGLLPFSIFLPQTLRYIWQNRHNDTILYLFLIAIIYTSFFAISKTKLPNYTVPVYPPLAILIAKYLENIKIKKSILYSLLFLGFLGVSLTTISYIALSQDKNLYLLKNYAIYFSLLIFGSLLAIYFYLKKDIMKIIISLTASGILLTIIILGVVMPQIDKESSVRYIMQFIDKNQPVGYYKRFNPAFAFYIGKKIQPLESKQQIQDFLASNQKSYILTREEYLKELEGLNLNVVAKKKDLFENPVSVLLTNY